MAGEPARASGRLLNGFVVSTLAVVLIFISFTGVTHLSARGKESAAKLLSKLAREKKPVKRAKLEVRLGTVYLAEAAADYQNGHIPQGRKLLGSFLSDIETAWTTLQASGRNAAKKPDGFQQLEMALDQDARRLTDLRRQLFYLYRPPIDQTLAQVNQIHGKVLLALFPGAIPPGSRQAPKIQASQSKVQQP